MFSVLYPTTHRFIKLFRFLFLLQNSKCVAPGLVTGDVEVSLIRMLFVMLHQKTTKKHIFSVFKNKRACEVHGFWLTGWLIGRLLDGKAPDDQGQAR